eukprot:824656-Rhodomonas_salina.1
MRLAEPREAPCKRRRVEWRVLVLQLRGFRCRELRVHPWPRCRHALLRAAMPRVCLRLLATDSACRLRSSALFLLDHGMAAYLDGHVPV